MLVVEDARDTRESLPLLLEMRGYHVVVASDGREALGCLRDKGLRPHVVLLDLVMPGMDGVSLHEQMVADAELAAIPVIALTGHEGLRQRALTSGIAQALLKPCGLDELLRLADGLSARAVEAARMPRASGADPAP